MRSAFGALLLGLLLGAVTLPVAPAVGAQGTLTVGGTATVSGTGGAGLRVRSRPGAGQPVVILLAEGRTVPILEGPATASGVTWYRVQTRGPAGWVMARYLVPGAATAPGTSSAASAPSRSAAPTPVPRPAPTSAPVPASSGGTPRSFIAKVTGYATGDAGVGTITATGTVARWGVVSVDPQVIPLGSQLEIEGIGGRFVAEDTGGAVRGAHVDVFLPDSAATSGFTTQHRRVTIVREGAGR